MHFVHGAFLALIGSGERQVVGRTLYELLGTDDPSQPLTAAHLRALNGESAQCDHPVEDRGFDVRVEPFRDADGRIVGCLGLALPSDEQLSIQELVQESEERFRKIFEYSNDAIFIIDPKTDEILDVNAQACTKLGYEREELLSLRVSDIHPDRMRG